ncbi:MAG TPA: VCBS repeat-containing protein [Kofleriaceae bacterium]|nr:VCBS repeat-containing protein [Kofleriaceae bacterium]
MGIAVEAITGGQTAIASFGNQTWSAWAPAGASLANLAAFSGDFNGDGYGDTGVTGTDPSSGHRFWYIDYGDGHGNFPYQSVYDSGTWGTGEPNAFSGDFNGDGLADIGLTGADGYWYIAYGDGTGKFAAPTSYYWGNNAANVFTGDFNGDGLWDIGVTGTAAQTDRNWYIRYGNGHGSFGNQTVYSWGNPVTNVFAGDFNGDGLWDIGATGTAAQTDRNWYIRYGNGQGNFGNQTFYDWGNGATNVFTGDFDGNKVWDIGVTGAMTANDPFWFIRYRLPLPVTPADQKLSAWSGSPGMSTDGANPRFELILAAPSTVEIDLRSQPSCVDTYLYLYDVTMQTLITQDDNSGDCWNSRITITLNAGKYILVAATPKRSTTVTVAASTSFRPIRRPTLAA